MKNLRIKLGVIKHHTTILLREWTYRMSQEERSIFWEVILSVILNKKMYMYMCPLPNDFRDRAISLHSSRIVNKKEILRTVSNTGIYSSSDKIGKIFENSTVNVSALCNFCEEMACCSSVQCTV
jgi:hypothetical protein